MSKKSLKCPVRQIASELRAYRAILRANFRTDEELCTDVRLQILPDGSWAVHTGDSSYDQDHRGVWGSASVPFSGRFDSMAMARALWNQCVDMAVDGFDGPTLHYTNELIY
jgi:hypothetical protein